MNEKILIIEDDSATRKYLYRILEKQDYTIKTAEEGNKGLLVSLNFKPSLIILDIDLPGISGYEVCKTIRENTDKYGEPLVLMLTSKSELDDLSKGFKSGADDYLKKPFEVEELLLRIQALLKRIVKNTKKETCYKTISFEEESEIVFEKDKEIRVSKVEHDLLAYFIINQGITLSREKIFREVWEDNIDINIDIVNVYIFRLRDKFSCIKNNLKTLKGFGYRLEK